MQKIGYEAFEDCSALKSIEIPRNVKEMGMACFWECSNLKEIVFNGDPFIEDDGFFFDMSAYSASHLLKVYAPENSKVAQWCRDKGFLVYTLADE